MQWLECLLCLHVCCQGYSASGLGGDSSLSGHKTQESESGLLPRLKVRGFYYITVYPVRPNKKPHNPLFIKWKSILSSTVLHVTWQTGCPPACPHYWCFASVLQILRFVLAGCWPGVRSRHRATEASMSPTSHLPGGMAWPSVLWFTARGLSSCENTHKSIHIYSCGNVGH